MLVRINDAYFILDSVCVSYHDIEICSPKSTWAVNTPSVNVIHTFSSAMDQGIATYHFAGQLICEYTFIRTRDSCYTYGDGCKYCSMNRSAGDSVIMTAIIRITNMDEAKDQSSLTSTYSSDPHLDNRVQIQKFSVAGIRME